MSLQLGLMVFDNDKKRPLENKVHNAYHSFLARFGKEPDLCAVHPSTVVEGVESVIPIVTDPYVMVNHVWIGIEEITDPIDLEE